jgi:hypothetical protein
MRKRRLKLLNKYINAYHIKLIKERRYCGMYAREVDVTRLRKRALLGNGRLQQYPDGAFYRVGPQAINPRERSLERALLRILRSLLRIELSRTAPRDRS